MENLCTIEENVKWMVQPLWKTEQQLFKNFKIEISDD